MLLNIVIPPGMKPGQKIQATSLLVLPTSGVFFGLTFFFGLTKVLKDFFVFFFVFGGEQIQGPDGVIAPWPDLQWLNRS